MQILFGYYIKSSADGYASYLIMNSWAILSISSRLIPTLTLDMSEDTVLAAKLEAYFRASICSGVKI